MPDDQKIILHLEITLEADQLNMGAREYVAGEESTIRNYEQIRVSMDRIENQCREMVKTLNRANRNGRLSQGLLTKLKEVGQILFDELFPLPIKEKLNETSASYLKLDVTDQLVQIPWELVHNGHGFLCNRFSMGRMVKTRQPVVTDQRRRLGRPLKAMILADPEGDLEGAYGEGTRIRDAMDADKETVNATLRAGNIQSDFVRKKIRNFDIIHFAGHAHYDGQDPAKSGWRLSGDTFRAGDVMKMAGSVSLPMPSLIFSNACQSARTEKWALTSRFQNEIFGLANAFLLTGVKHYVGTFWEILDDPSSYFALAFYKNLLTGRPIGEAMRGARHDTIQAYGEETVVWSSYVLYGDPAFSYVEHLGVRTAQEIPPLEKAALGTTKSKTRRDVVHFPEEKRKTSRRLLWGVFLGAVLMIVAGIWGYHVFDENALDQLKKDALVSYQEGRFTEALEAVGLLQKKRPVASLAYCIEGHILLRKGQWDEAELAYKNAADRSGDDVKIKSDALAGLGRIASLRKERDLALSYYRQASEIYPQGKTGYLSQAMLLEKDGRYEEALAVLGHVGDGDGHYSLSSLTHALQRKIAWSTKQERRKHLNQLLEDISSRAGKPGATSDGWSSFALTMLVKDFVTTGYSVSEGEEKLLVSALSNRLLQKSRVQIVERELLDDLLQEFKLETFDVVDPATALSVGKIMAARLVLTGHVRYTEKETKIAVKLIETETSRVVATVNAAFGVMTPVSLMAETLAEKLLKTIQNTYPLRGKIEKVFGNTVTLNIGSRMGVNVGQQFNVVSSQATLETTSVSDLTSEAKILAGQATLKKNMRVEIEENKEGV